MRVLLTSAPRLERLHNLVPLAWALRSAGHEAQIAGTAADSDTINRTGLVAVAADDPAALVDYAGLWEPDVVIWDPLAPGGAAAARSVGAVSLRMLGIADHLDGPAGDGRTGGEPVDADATADSTPPSLRTLPTGEPLLPVRYVPYEGPAVVPAWLRRKPRRRRVYVSVTGSATTLPDLFGALDGLDVEAICAVAVELVPDGTDLPSNVRLVDSVPLSALLPTCAAVVHDGAVLAAAVAFGVPQLTLADGPAGGAALAERIDHVLNDAAPRAHADRLRDEVLAMPSPRDVVPDIVRLVAGRPARV